MTKNTLQRLLLSLVLPCLLLNAALPASAQEKPPVQMGFSAWPGWFPWQVAQEKGLFEKNGVKVKLIWFEGYLDSINALAGGKIDANAQTLNDTISPVAAGAQQVIVLVNDNSTGNDQIIVREGINSVKDLKGKKIAADLGTVDHYLLLLGLEKAGLSQKDINFSPLESGSAAAAFVANKFDGVGVFAPFTTTALKRKGSKVLFSSKEFPGAIPDHLVFTKKFVKERPEDVQKLVNTWFETLAYIKANPEESVKIMAKRAGVTPEEYKDYDSGTTIFTVEQNLKAFTPGKDITHLNFAADKINDFLVRSGLTKKKADLKGIFDPRFVQNYAKQKGIKP